MLEPPLLKLIAQLPNLSTLNITPNYREYLNCSLSTRLPEGSFLALNKLWVPCTTFQSIKKFWQFIPLSKLETLALAIQSVSNDDDLIFIPTLCQASPRITGLSLSFPFVDDRAEEQEPYLIGEEEFESLLGLALESKFILRYAMFESDSAWARIANSWKGLTNIDCRYQPTSLDELTLLCSSLPKLKTICYDFDLEGAAGSVEHDWTPVGPRPVYPCLEELELTQLKLVEVMASREHSLSDLARYTN
ncbi:hypothetical protein FRC09_011837 [Ceratobasidium sp. 395]|nr:hypothetical protein FRC09_011837 [Ceratobasidium sp. 395]